ncbi:MAG TPA: acyltransferase family protein [Dongiaceae bacterium]|jgi:peptidoglycan/LPS O-acetylase OafA/YrhL|nr:acyltransferase family protein [Dongiaceae bacterium]
MARPNPLLQLLSAAGIGGAVSWLPAAAGSDTASAAHAKYRPDIDGLRAVAVLPVVFYHLNISLFSGGFVGVDVFFVISGYLITSLISAEMHEGTYSITRFYVRRARRIFPALFVMGAVSALFVFLFCLPSEAKRFSSTLAAATLFASNFYFFFTSDYFAPGAEAQPLLHTWSLAVEEQFYIFFPLILWLVRRYLAAREKLVMIALALLSLAISAWLVRVDRTAAFYLLHSRAWELLLGALLAIGTVPAIRSRALANALGIIGLALIVGSVLLYKEQMAFPGLAALAPCVGAALIIHAGKESSLLASRALSLAPVRFIGLISYSLYLWHWPIDVLSRYVAFWYGWDPDLKPHKVVVLALSLVCAILSWHFVEKPFRQRPYRFGSFATLSTSAAVMAALVVLAGAIYPLSQRLWSMPQDAERVLATLDYRPSESQKACFLNPQTNELRYFDQAGCLALSDTKKNWLLLGDSHASDLWAGLSGVNPQVNLMQGTGSGCKPLIDIPGERRCTELMNFLFSDFIPKHHFELILLSARWSPGNIDKLKQTAEALKPYADRVIVLGPRVEYKQDLPWLLTASMLKHDPSLVNRFRLTKQRQTDRLFADQLRQDGIGYISLYSAICPEGQCRVTDQDGLPLAFDYGHLTRSGSLFVAQQIKKSGAL